VRGVVRENAANPDLAHRAAPKRQARHQVAYLLRMEAGQLRRRALALTGGAGRAKVNLAQLVKETVLKLVHTDPPAPTGVANRATG
jgi:hypothetical protein